MTTLFSTHDVATTLPDAPTIPQPDLALSLALVPSHWERGGVAGWWLVYADGSKLPYSVVGIERFEERTGLVLPIK